jgi:purine-binding chemotaxis protein CheW
MQTEMSAKPDSGAPTRAGKYLLFRLGNEEYGIAVMRVREIIGQHDIAVVPNTPAFVMGVVNLRGKVIPIIDLRIKLGLPAERTDRTCTVVVQIESESSQILAGVIVDEVREVVNIKAEDIDDTPDFGHWQDRAHILGIAKIASGVRILLDSDKVLAPSEWQVGASCPL